MLIVASRRNGAAGTPGAKAARPAAGVSTVSSRKSQISPGRRRSHGSPSAHWRKGSMSSRAFSIGRVRTSSCCRRSISGASSATASWRRRISSGAAGWSSQSASALFPGGVCTVPSNWASEARPNRLRSRAIGRSASSGSGRDGIGRAEASRASRSSPSALIVRSSPSRRCRLMTRSWYGSTQKKATSQNPAPAHHCHPGVPP